MAVVERKRRITLPVIVGVISLAGSLVAGGRYLLTPWFVTAAMDALGDEIKEQASIQAAPANNGVKSMLTKDIKRLEGAVRLEKAAQKRLAVVTELDDIRLSNLEGELEEARKGLAEFEAQSAIAKAAAR